MVLLQNGHLVKISKFQKMDAYLNDLKIGAQRIFHERKD